MAGRRIALGAVIGAVVGAIVIGGLAYIVTGEAGVAVGSGVGGAMILGVIGSLLANFTKYGAGDAAPDVPTGAAAREPRRCPDG